MVGTDSYFCVNDEPHSLQRTLMTTETQASKRVCHKKNYTSNNSSSTL